MTTTVLPEQALPERLQSPIAPHEAPPDWPAPQPPPQGPDAPRGDGGGRRLATRLFRGKPTDPAWVRPSLLALLTATAVLYLWGLGASGWANSFYSAAVQAGTKSWKAWFFGSFDSSNFITVDKPPAALWVMGLSARLFGVNAWSILVPEALAGVATVGVLYATVRRWFSPAGALIAGAVCALTPVAVLMFRFNNPDALLVLLLTLGAYAMVRALETGRTRWLVLASTVVGFGFLTKMLQALLVVPAFALVYLIAGPPKLGRRLGQLAIACAALLAAAGWWVAIVEVFPKSARPYIGGSRNNSVLNLIFGYNGFGRLTGNETGSVGGNGGVASMWGPTGWTRLFNSQFGGQVSWLLPAALILLASGLALSWRARRTDRLRSALILWGGWLLVTGLVFSLGQGIIHPYYTVALAPAIGALVGIGACVFWARRSRWLSRAVLSVTVLATALWSYALLERTPTWNGWLRPAVLVLGIGAALAIWFGEGLRRHTAAAFVVAALGAGLAAPFAYSVATAATAHTGAIPSAGPSGGFGAPGGGVPGGRGGPGGFARFGGARPGTDGGFAPPNFGTGGPAGNATTNTGNAGTGNPFPGNGGGAGGLLNASTPPAELVATLDQNASNYTWVAATVGANEASGYQLATDHAVMAVGGFNGTDPTPTLAQFEQYVSEGKIHYFIAGGGFANPGVTGGRGGAGGSSASSSITSWVESHYHSVTVGGITLYDLTSPVA